jgi:alkanesulfonate monooxygenase SsuD/methylene tetrahydromethanopterin reductase-like flavin-dependent oxidoreductase (luciferase family)
MEYGITLFSQVDSWKTARRAEELGFSTVWFYDSQLLCADVFVAMALAAEHTSRIRLATGVLVPTNRLAPVAANAFASLAKIAPGRILFGVGTGFTARNTMGLGPMPLRDLREYVRVVRALAQNQTVECTLEGKPRQIRFLNPDLGLIEVGDPLPLHFSAFAPKARALTAEMGDGWMTFMSRPEQALAELAAVHEACRAIGRDAKTLYATAFSLGCVLAEGEKADGPRAMAQAGPWIPVLFHAFVEQSIDEILPPGIRDSIDEYRSLVETYEPRDARYLTVHRGHLAFVRPEERRFVTAERIRAFTLTGTVAEIRDRVRMLRDGGFEQLTIQLVPGHEDAIEDWARVFEKV